MYSPILRNRQSEMLACRDLPKDILRHLMPVFDVAAPTKSADRVKGLKYVESNIARTEKLASGFRAVFVDSSELDPSFRLAGDMHPLEAAANAVINGGSVPIPVTGLHRDAAHNEIALGVMNDLDQKRICLRLDATDISTARLTYKGILEFLAAEDINSKNVYLLFDLQCIHGQDQEAIVKLVDRLFKALQDRKWAGIIIGGYGIPDQLSAAVSTNDQAYLMRIEQAVFFEIAKNETVTPVWFADYTTLTPSMVELDWRLISKVMTPKALYTLENSWFVVRGGAFSSHPDGYAQYYSIADEIVALEEYSGEQYCFGDKYIWDCSQRTGSGGSPASWIKACVNHHITFTARTHAI